MAQAAELGQDTYTDLTDVALFPDLLESLSAEVQRRLGLTYRPVIKHLDRALDGDVGVWRWGQGHGGGG